MDGGLRVATTGGFVWELPAPPLPAPLLPLPQDKRDADLNLEFWKKYQMQRWEATSLPLLPSVLSGCGIFLVHFSPIIKSLEALQFIRQTEASKAKV